MSGITGNWLPAVWLKVGNGTAGDITVALNGEDAYIEGTFEVNFDGITNIGSITADGAIAFTPGSTSGITFNLDADSLFTLSSSVANADKIVIQPYNTGAGTFTGTLTSGDLTGNVTWTLPSATTTLMGNPMTTAGDIIYGGASGAPTRLAGSGTNGWVLKYNTGTSAPYWDADANTTYTAGNDIDFSGTQIDLEPTLNFVHTIVGVASTNLALSTLTAGDITLTPAVATGLVNVLTGNLKVGNGTPTVALNGEDAYIEGTLEVDGSTRLDGALDSNGDLSIADTNIAFDGATTTFTTTGAFTLTPGGAVTLGDGGDTMVINTSDWDISATGDMTNIGGITADGAIAFTPSSTSGITFNLDADSLFTLSSSVANADKIVIQPYNTGAGTFTGTLTSGDLTGNVTWTLPSATTTLMGNPMTTAGDIIYGGASGAPTRLAGSGTNGWVLKYNTGTSAPYWDADANTTYTAGNDIDFSGTQIDLEPTLNFVHTIVGVASTNLALSTLTAGDITLTPAVATGLVNVLTGNLKVGNGTPTVALNGEDAYIEGTLEVDGSTRLDGALDSNGDLSIADTNIAFDGATTTFTTTGAFTLTPGGAVTLGDGGDTMAINTSDWDISATGDMTNIGSITADGAIAFTPGSTSGITFNLDADSLFTLSSSVANADKIVIQPYNTGAGTFTGTLTSGDLTGNVTWTLPSATTTLMGNPMTTAGDIIYGGASGAPTRLAGSGTNGWVLKYNTGTSAPYWDADANTTYTAGNDIDFSGTQIDLEPTLNFVHTIVGVASTNLALSTLTAGDITLTPAVATGLVNVLTGNLKVGNGTPTVALNGEDAYIEGTLEVDGSTRLDGALDSNGDLSIADTNIAFDGATTTFTTTGAFTLTPGGAVTLGDGGDTMAINTSDWDISATGDMTNIGSITADGAIAFTPGSTSGITFNLDADSLFTLSSSVANADKIVIQPYNTGAGTFTGTLTSGDLTGNVTWTLPSATTTLMGNPMTTAGDIIYGGASGAPTRLAGSGTNGWVLKYNTGTSAPYWAVDEVGTDTTYSAGNDIDLSGTQIDLEPQLDFVTTITRASSNLTLSTTTSGNLILTSAGTGADALSLTTTAGGMDISVTGNAAGEDLDITTVGAATEMRLTSASTTADAIRLNASAGGIDIDAANSTLTITNTANSAADDLTIAVVGAFDSSLVLSSAGTGTDAIDINVTGTGGDLDIDVNDAITMDSTSLAINTGTWDVTAAGAASGLTGISSSGNIDLSALAAGGMVKAAVTTGRLSIATPGTDYLNNPMTTAGDIIYGGASGAPTRLAGSGTNGWVLKYNTGTSAPYWDAASGGTYTAANGLTLNVAAFELGGTLSRLTNIDTNANNLNFSGTGNVGIGTTAPTMKLQVGTTLGTISGSYMGIGDSAGNSGLYVGEDANNRGSFSWNASNDSLDLNVRSSSTSYGGLSIKNGQVGISNSGFVFAPITGVQLELASATGATLALRRDDTSIVQQNELGSLSFYSNDTQLGGNTNVAYVRAVAQNDFTSAYGPTRLEFGTASDSQTVSTKMTLDRDGQLGIGTTGPTAKLDVVGDARIRGAITLDPASSTAITAEGTIYYDSDVDHLYVRTGDAAFHRLAMDLTKYSATNASVSNQSYLGITHNQNTNDLNIVAWVKDKISGLWQVANSKQTAIKHALENEFDQASSSGMIRTETSQTEVKLKPAIDLGTGADGAITIAANTNINTANSISGRTCSDGGDAVNYSVSSLTSTSATLSTTPTSGCLNVGDEVLLINLQGTSTNNGNVGNYETLRVSSVSGSTVNFTTGKVNYYGDNLTDDTNLGTATSNQRVMIQRVPNYTTVNVNSTFTFSPTAWNRIKGGVMFFRATGTVTVAGTISASGTGYRGGVGDSEGGQNGESFDGYYGTGGNPSSQGGGASPGSTVVAGSTGYRGGGGGGGGGKGTTASAGGAGGAGGGYGGGGGGGGGGGSYNGDATGRAGGDGATTTGVGGGGGGGAGQGVGGDAGSAGTNGRGTGGVAGSGTQTGEGGTATFTGSAEGGGGGGGGGLYGDTSLSKLHLGSGGAAGGRGILANVYTDGKSGGAAGGIVAIAANSMSVTGYIYSNGSQGTAAGGGAGAGGGGSGGSILIKSNTATLGTARITSTGGAVRANTGYSGGSGGGGVGRIAVYYGTSVSGTSTPSYTSAASGYNTYGLYHSPVVNTPNATTYENIRWEGLLNTYGKIAVQTRSGNTTNPTDGTWESWRPFTVTTNYLSLHTADTHTDWTGTNATVAEGDVARNIDHFEDEDEATVGNITKITSSTAGGYAEATISSANISTYDYVAAWVRASQPGTTLRLGIGEAAATEQTEEILIDTADTWQKVYWDVSDITSTGRDGITKLRLTNLTATSNTIYLDNIRAEKLLTTSAGSKISSTPNNYLQYRVIMTTTNAATSIYQPVLHNISFTYSDGYKIEQVDANNVRVYNYSGETQEMRLDAIVHGADLAEWYTIDDPAIEAGDVVALTGTLDVFDVPILKKASSATDPNIVGAISTRAGQTLGLEAPNRRLLGLVGRIPVKVASDSGAIKAGDYLTASTEPGKARKAGIGDITIGKALENWQPGANGPTVLMFIGTGPRIPLLSDLSNAIVRRVETATQSIYSVIDSGGEAVNAIGLYAKAMVGTLEVGLANIANLNADKVTSISLDTDQFSAFTATVSGTLYAKEVVSPTIISLEDNLATLSARVGYLETQVAGGAAPQPVPVATVAGVVDNFTQDLSLLKGEQASISAALESYAQKVDLALELTASQSALISSLLSPISTEAATVAYDLNLDVESIFVSDFLSVLGDTILTDLTVTNNLTVSSIDSIDGNLKLIGGLMTLDALGSLVTIQGDLHVAGNITANSLTLSGVEGLTTTDATISGTLTVNTLINADLDILKTQIATLSAQTTSPAIVSDGGVATPTATINGPILTASTSAGTTQIPEGYSHLTIENPLITQNTLIYLTPLSSTGNRTLYVKLQQVGQAIIGFDTPNTVPVSFNWWLVEPTFQASE
jgi:hypothetical protein